MYFRTLFNYVLFGRWSGRNCNEIPDLILEVARMGILSNIAASLRDCLPTNVFVFNDFYCLTLAAGSILLSSLTVTVVTESIFLYK